MNIPKTKDTISDVRASADIFVIPFFANAMHYTSKSYNISNIAFLFSDFIFL